MLIDGSEERAVQCRCGTLAEVIRETECFDALCAPTAISTAVAVRHPILRTARTALGPSIVTPTSSAPRRPERSRRGHPQRPGVDGAKRKERLFEDILRLRRAEQRSPGVRDIVTVRSHLEQELGGSVSRSLAARLLGVSHTALQKWIDAGDVPVVITPSGSTEVPLAALVDLHEAITAERETGRRRLHVIEPAMTQARARAQALDPTHLIDPGGTGDAHDRAERRSRAYHAAVARHLRKSTVERALHQLWRWDEDGTIDPRYAEAWEEVLRRPLSDIKRVLTDETQQARDLRQNSPFAGALSEPERRKILDEIR